MEWTAAFRLDYKRTKATPRHKDIETLLPEIVGRLVDNKHTLRRTLGYICGSMIPNHLQTLFWDTNLDTFTPEAYPDYTIFRVLEYGDEEAITWLREKFSEGDIRRVLCTERRLSPKSANFWALVYGVPSRESAALNENR